MTDASIEGFQPEVSAPIPPSPRRALSRDTAVRLTADVLGLVLGTAGAVITARWLGPDGKGIAATLAFLAMLLIRVATLGLGDSGVVVVGRGNASLRTAFAANAAASLFSSVAAAAIFAPIAILVIGPESSNIWLALAATGLSIPIGTAHDVVSHALTMEQRIVRSSISVAVIAAATLAGFVLFVIALDLEVLGAALGALVGIAAGVVTSIAFLSPTLRVRPRWNPEYLREAVPFGLRLEASYLVTLAAGRLDLLLVFTILGATEAGNYSVALTIGSLVAMVPFALSYASFPRLAYSGRNDALELALRSWRVGVVGSSLIGAMLAILTPVLVPFAFGSDFDPAVTPALLLIVASILTGGQWTLARWLAARGEPGTLLVSFSISLATMLALDAALIPTAELTGAAIACVVSAALGLAWCLRIVRSQGVPGRRLLPGSRDVRDLAAGLSSLVGSLAAAVKNALAR